MSDNELLIPIAVVFLFGGGLMFVLLFSIFKDLITGIFNYDYNELKSGLSELPQNVFTVRLSAINFVIFHGFWVTTEIYSDFVIFKMFNRALVVNDRFQLELTDNYTSRLNVTSGNSKLRLPLGKREYEIIKEFLENEND